jgi:hypothetical protein
LATAYALAWRGDLELLGILTDNPQNMEKMPELLKHFERRPDEHIYHPRSPDISAVAQLNYFTGRAVPVTTGTVWPTKPGDKVREDNLPKDLAGVQMLLGILDRSSEPVAILIGGSSQDPLRT